MPPAEPTDRQLRAAVYKVVRAYLEVERGLRAYEQLERFVTAAEYRRHRNRPCDPRLRTGRAVLPTDVGPIHLDRHLLGQITATVTTREEDQRWGALVLHFVRQRDGRWRIDQLERLRRPSVARQPTPSARVDLDLRIEHVVEERRLADAAHRAMTTRLTEARNTTGRRADDVEMLEAQQRAWGRRRAELDVELKSLQDSRDLQQPFREADASPAAPAAPTEPRTKQGLDQQPPERNVHLSTLTQPIEVSHRQLTAALGPIPHDDWRRRLWQGLADEIRTYRRRWKITDPRTLLGPETNDPDQQRERQELAALLRASARELSNEPRRSHDLPSDADIARAAARQYGRWVVTER